MESRGAWREPMVWIVAGLPAASVVAGLALVFTAVNSNGDDIVNDRVRRTGQAQVAELGPDAQSRSLQLAAVLRLTDGTLELLPVSGRFARDQSLSLLLSHPTDSRLDQRLALLPGVHGWHANTDIQAGHDWIVQLTPVEGQWRLRGRIRANERSAYLGPSISAD